MIRDKALFRGVMRKEEASIALLLARMASEREKWKMCYMRFFATFISHLARCWVLLFPKKSLYPSHKTLKSEKIYNVCVHYTFICVHICYFRVYATEKKRAKERKIHTAKRESTFLLRASKASFSHYYLNSFFIIIKYAWSFFSHTNMRRGCFNLVRLSRWLVMERVQTVCTVTSIPFRNSTELAFDREPWNFCEIYREHSTMCLRRLYQ